MSLRKAVQRSYEQLHQDNDGHDQSHHLLDGTGSTGPATADIQTGEQVVVVGHGAEYEQPDGGMYQHADPLLRICSFCMEQGLPSPWARSTLCEPEIRKRGRATGCQFCVIFDLALKHFIPASGWEEADKQSVLLDINQGAPWQLTIFTRPRVRCELFGITGTPCLWPSLPTGLRHETCTGSPKYLDRIMQWALRCATEHRLCHAEGSAFAPKRLLDIGSKNGQRVRLIETQELEPEKYVCLSHVWGKNQPLRTLSTNLIEHMSGIPLASLPQTFRDAIIVTRHLNVRYIWIDSLCILQDDHSDWVAQSAQMADVFGHAFLTICASLAEDASHGLFVSSAPCEMEVEIKDVRLPPTGVFVCPQTNHEQYGRTTLLYSNVLVAAPLLKRAWVLQELLLSPRIVHFDKRDVIWQCNQTSSCCCSSNDIHGLHSMNIKDHVAPVMSGDEPDWYNAWREVVRSYSFKDITVETDRLPALSGIAKRFQARCGSRYLAGLWESTLVQDLCWYTIFRGPERRPSNHLAPTWSWCSVFSAVSHQRRITSTDALVHEAICTQATSDPTGAVSSGLVRLSVRLAVGRLASMDDRIGTESSRPAFSYSDKESWPFDPDALLDDFEFGGDANQSARTRTGDTLYAALLGSTGYFDVLIISALILVKTGRTDQEFRRVGLLRNYEMVDIWTRDAIEHQVITIV